MPSEARGHARRAEPGAVIELRLRTGQLAYAQYVRPGWHAPLIRVMPGIFDEPLDRRALRGLIARPSQFRTQYHLDTTIGRREGRIVAHLPVPETESGMPPLRFIADVQPEVGTIIEPDYAWITGAEYLERHPGADLSTLPLWEIPFYGTLSWMIEKHWVPSMARGLALGIPDDEEPTPAPPPPDEKPKKRRIHTTHISIFQKRDDAEKAAEAIRELGLKNIEVDQDAGTDEWVVWAQRPGRPDPDTEDQVEQIAAANNGYYDGNMVGPLN